jgi:hypothetical protein
MGDGRSPAQWYRLLVALLSGTAERPAAGNELASCARRFAGSTGRLLDDQLTLAIALVRSGEVEAARRLVVDVEREVRVEGNLLMDRAGEIGVRIEPPGVVRLFVARVAAAAVFVVCVGAVPGAGVAVAMLS